MGTHHLVVVGVDGSEGGRRALDWAATEAAARGGAVRAVLAWSWDGLEYGLQYGLPAADDPRRERDRLERLLDREIAALAARRGTSAPVTGAVVEGRPAPVLTAAARGADLLVLGSHGHGRVHRTVLGSVSADCVRTAPCPVVVIPARHAGAPAEPALRG